MELFGSLMTVTKPLFREMLRSETERPVTCVVADGALLFTHEVVDYKYLFCYVFVLFYNNASKQPSILAYLLILMEYLGILFLFPILCWLF